MEAAFVPPSTADPPLQPPTMCGVSPDDDTYSVKAKWKEEVVYREGDQSIVFDAGWGVEPPVLYVPSEWAWDLSTPAWLHGRRAEVVARLERDSRHVIAIDDILDARLQERVGAATPASVRVEVVRLGRPPGGRVGPGDAGRRREHAHAVGPADDGAATFPRASAGSHVAMSRASR